MLITSYYECKFTIHYFHENCIKKSLNLYKIRLFLFFASESLFAIIYAIAHQLNRVSTGIAFYCCDDALCNFCYSKRRFWAALIHKPLFYGANKKILNFATILLMVTSVRLQGEGDPLW